MKNQSGMLQPGVIVSGPERVYTVVSILGKGGFGITYLVTGKIKVGNITVEAQFALKEHFISSLCSRDRITQAVVYSEPVAEEVDRSLQAFIKEAYRLQKLGIDHPNIVKINEVFEANNTAYYVMEYLGGTTLKDYVATVGPMMPVAAKTLLRPVIEAVAMLHQNNIAHYDIKPGNIMLHEDEDGKVRPVLIDFGLAKHYNDMGHATSTLAASGYTPGYAPVEQYAGISKFSPQCDVYALAATLYFCLTGHAPKTAFELRREDIESELAELLDAAEIQSLLHAFAMMPEARTRDASALLADLFPETISDVHGELDRFYKGIKPTPETLHGPESVNEMVGAESLPIIENGEKEDYPERSRSSKVKYLIIGVVGLIVASLIIVWQSTSEDESPVSIGVEEISDITFSPRTTYKNLDLFTTRNDVNYFFSQKEWSQLSQAEQKLFTRKGIVLMNKGIEFVIDLYDSGEEMTWEEAITKYGSSLPSKEQAEIMTSQYMATNRAIIAFGGSKGPDCRYWTGTEYGKESSYAWGYTMYTGAGVYKLKKKNTYKVRAVIPVQLPLRE